MYNPDSQHRSSTLFLRNMRDSDVHSNVFRDTASAPEYLTYLVDNGLTSLVDAYPLDYFTYAHSNLIRIETSDTTGLSARNQVTFVNDFYDNQFLRIKSFQLLGLSAAAYYQGSIMHVEQENTLTDFELHFRLNEIKHCKMIGPTGSLLHFKSVTHVRLLSNQVHYAG